MKGSLYSAHFGATPYFSNRFLISCFKASASPTNKKKNTQNVEFVVIFLKRLNSGALINVCYREH